MNKSLEEKLLKIFDEFWEKEVNNVFELKDHEQYGAINRRLLKVFFRKMMQEVESSSLAQYKREILEKVIGEDEEGIGINNYHNGINRKQKARNEFRQELRNRLKELEL